MFVWLTVTGDISATLWIESSEVRDSSLRGMQPEQDLR